jgi:8-oxo-dGTP pyrophosphatase MutT (NUDIX family)
MKELRGNKNHPHGYSCGGVVWRKNKKNELEVLLLHFFKTNHWDYNSWHLPKGTMHEGETKKETTRREIEEETGYEVEVKKYLGKLKSTWNYQDQGTIINKTTYYFICQPIKKLRSTPPDYGKVEWVEINKAIKNVSKLPIFEKEEIILKKFKHFQLS